ncbi:hypothetical protein AAES_148625 [Amazona aestiva]|uniref:Uncharacterized protein n=1 Tax=Amazona aestiva TaxID=12930 RepID=A0A0Q3P3Y2_AMAAE|nr:hypothetical protein AAES_148625 [Amazona aestiva]
MPGTSEAGHGKTAATPGQGAPDPWRSISPADGIVVPLQPNGTRVPMEIAMLKKGNVFVNSVTMLGGGYATPKPKQRLPFHTEAATSADLNWRTGTRVRLEGSPGNRRGLRKRG